jgi:hypothetical protein
VREALRQSVAVARLTLASYVRSGWAAGEVVLLLGVVAISTGGSDPRSPHPVAAYFFGLHGVDFVGITALGAVVMVRRSIGLRTLVVLSRLGSRASYPAGLVLASAALRVPLLALLVALGLGTGRLGAADLVAVPAAGAALLANAVLAGAVTIALLAPFSGRRELLLAVVYAAAMLAPAIDLPEPARAAQAIAQLPLWPVAANYQAGATASALPVELLTIPLVAAYAAAVSLVAGLRFARRDVVL